MRWSAVAPETKWCSQLNSVINRLKIFQFVDLTSTAVVALLSFSIPGTEYKYTIVNIRIVIIYSCCCSTDSDMNMSDTASTCITCSSRNSSLLIEVELWAGLSSASTKRMVNWVVKSANHHGDTQLGQITNKAPPGRGGAAGGASRGPLWRRRQKVAKVPLLQFGEFPLWKVG